MNEKNEKEKKQLYKVRANIMKALSHPLRLEIVESLEKGEKCVTEISEIVGSKRSNVSRHLTVLTKAELLNSRKEGLNMYYSLKCPCVLDFFSCVEKVLKEQIKEKIRLLRKTIR
ncbi:MAG: metalloregulator ArsR/SmtB family transcription factor [Planctomycetota bacterium]|nr:metalloregulator ArsR/SmtB family transcription factor [Planctomycetota bacterium]